MAPLGKMDHRDARGGELGSGYLEDGMSHISSGFAFKLKAFSNVGIRLASLKRHFPEHSI